MLALSWLALLEWLAGRWQRAQEHAAAALELAEQAGWEFNSLRRCTSRRRWRRTSVGSSRRAQLRRALEISGGEFFRILTLGVLGHLELALGNLDAADRYLRELPARLLAGGYNAVPDSIWPDTIETLIALEQARVYLEQYEPRARRSSRRCRLF